MKNNVECKSIPISLPEDVAREIDALIGTLPAECAYQRKAIDCTYMFEPGERSEVSILTNATIDKTNEVVIPEGVDLVQFRKVGTVFWDHNYEKAIGTCAWIKLHQGREIRAKTVYPEKPVEIEINRPWLPDEVWALTKCQPPILRAKSIGFLPLVPARKATPEELVEHPDWINAKVWEKTMLLEYSACTMGINYESLVLAVNQKSIKQDSLGDLGIAMPAVVEEQKPAEPVVVEPPVKKYTKEELELLIAPYQVAKKAPKRKKISDEELMRLVLAQIDPQRIVMRAEKLFRERGRA
jgi:hypothetical protein